MPRSAPALIPAKVSAAKAGAFELGICGAIGLVIAGPLGAWADGAAPQNVAHLIAFLGLGGAAPLLVLPAGIPGIYPPGSDRLGLVKNRLMPGPSGQEFFTQSRRAPAQVAGRRGWRMKP